MKKTRRNIGRRRTSDAVEILDAMIGDDPKLRQMADQVYEDAVIGQLIYDLRTGAGLTQNQLARLVGTDQSVISRLEDADYGGHSSSMLRRIGAALGKRLVIRFVDQKASANGRDRAARKPLRTARAAKRYRARAA